MTTKTKAARRSCNYDTRQNVHSKDSSIISNYNRGSLVFGVIFAITFGLMFVHSAVML